MRRGFVIAGALLGALLVSGTAALGHHSLQAVFDESQIVTIKGVVSKVEWVNPHVYLYMDVTDPAAGKVGTWMIETFPPTTLRRAGITRDKLGVGENVALEGYAARNGAQTLFLRKMTFATGQELLIGLGDISTVK
jgi:Family of unknown function (DUF6152)